MSGTPAAEIVVDEALIRALIAEQFPIYARRQLDFAGEGWDNFTWRLGADLAIRLPRRAVAVPLLVMVAFAGLSGPWPGQRSGHSGCAYRRTPGRARMAPPSW